MRTEYIQRTTSKTQEVTLGYWDKDNEKWITIGPNNVEEVAEVLKTSPELLGALASTFDDLLDNLNADLIAIWERLNMLESRIEEKL